MIYQKGLFKPVTFAHASPVVAWPEAIFQPTQKGDNMKKRITLHRNGSVTYWSVYHQSWTKGALYVPDKELAAMNETDRKRVIDHLSRWVAPVSERGNYESYLPE